MRILLLCFLIAAPLISYADNKCATVGGAMEQSLFNAVTHDLSIDSKTIQRNKTMVQILNASPMS